MPIPRLVPWMFSIGMMVLAAGVVSGQNYPTKPIRMLTAGFGGGSDFATRLVAQGLSTSLGQQVIVDSRVGGVIIADIAAKCS